MSVIYTLYIYFQCIGWKCEARASNKICITRTPTRILKSRPVTTKDAQFAAIHKTARINQIKAVNNSQCQSYKGMFDMKPW